MSGWSWKDVKSTRAPEASVEVRFKLAGAQAEQLRTMADEASISPSELARRLVVDVCDDDRTAHGEPS